MTQLEIVPAIMIGGAGSRLWPLSRANKPKQFLNLGGNASMFQDTVARFAVPGFRPAWLMAGVDTLVHVTTQLEDLHLACDGIIVEPAMRGTAAAIAAISVAFRDMDPEALLLVAPADHFIKDEASFRQAVIGAAPVAAAGSIVTFGIAPTGPETGFGYIAGSSPVSYGGQTVGYRIGPQGFHEKPDLHRAEEFVSQGYLWNAGIFLFKAETMIEELRRYAPETLAAVERAMREADRKVNWKRQVIAPAQAAFEMAPLDLPIDIAVMEQTDRAVVVPCEGIGWNDVGSLSALWEIAKKDDAGNAVKGDVLLQETHNVYVHSATGRKTVVAHCKDLLIVDTEDALIVLPTSQAQTVKSIVKELKRIGSPQLRYQKDATFDWGRVHVDASDTNHVSLSVHLQHGGELRRPVVAAFETWVVTNGTVAAEIDQRVMLVPAGNSFTLATGQSLVLTAIEEDARLAVVGAPTSTINLERLFGATIKPAMIESPPRPRAAGEPMGEVA
ncbi:mannose-1-phosphate guanylyltransferase [Devosia sp.]|jgi:mannose-1-phosphate guanylyltransferase/mannose-6-phosphate isomerase|uniref:mannose-1-phosphate guanylyltransferase n=1 Tax=Devosia sp. TaxID=1871048 RepID=UPI0037C1B11E